jgi:hypothetical protein
MLKITVDTKSITKQLDDIAKKQVRFATSVALNTTAKQAAADANEAMPSVFTHANPFTRMAVGVPQFATKANLSAMVGIKPKQAQYLGTEITGGTRTPALNTRLLSQALVLPGKGAAPLGSGAVKRIAQQAAADKARRAAVAAGTRKRGKLTGADAGVFSMSGRAPWGDVGGFFRRLPGHHLTRLIAFEASAQYPAKFDFKKQVMDSVARTFRGAFEKALARALASARK